MSTAWLLQWGTRYQSLPQLFGVEAEPLPTVQCFRHPSGDFAALDGYLVRSSNGSDSRRCDAEHLVELCRQRGERVLEDLSGAFLAVYWNAAKQRLSVVRDATGQQTAYFSWRSGTLLVSPCLETLLAAPDVSRDLNRPLIAELLQMRFHDQQLKETLYADIRRLPPGHRLALHRRRLVMARYWKPEEIIGSDPSADLEGALHAAFRRETRAADGVEMVDSLSSLALASEAAEGSSANKMLALIPNLAGSSGKRPAGLARELGLETVPVFCGLGPAIQPASTLSARPHRFLRTGLFDTAAAARVQRLILADDLGTAPPDHSWRSLLGSLRGRGENGLDSRQPPPWHRTSFRPRESGLRRILRHRWKYANPLKGAPIDHLVRAGELLVPHPLALLDREHDAAMARQHGVAPRFPLADRALVECRLANPDADLNTHLSAILEQRLAQRLEGRPSGTETSEIRFGNSDAMILQHRLLELRKKLQGFPQLSSLGLVGHASLASFTENFFAGRHSYGFPVWMALTFETWLSKASHLRSWESLVASPPPKRDAETTTLQLQPAAFAG